MTVTEKPKPAESVNLAALELDAMDRLGQLKEQRGRLALDSLVDSEIAAELVGVEQEIVATEQALERVELARAERGRRDAAAAAAAKAAAREEALGRARELQVQRSAAATAFDDAADALAAAAAWWLESCGEQDVALREAGRPAGDSAVRMRPFCLQAAFIRATRELRGMLNLEVTVPPSQQVRLAEGDVRPVEPEVSG